MQARLKQVDGKYIITGGPSNGNMKCGLGEKLVPAYVTYPSIESSILYVYTGPTVTVDEEGTKVDVVYGSGEKNIDVIKSELLGAFDTVFTEIDARSFRAVRSILTAQANGTTPDEYDVATMKKFEDAANANRAIIAEINAGVDFEFFKTNYARLVPVKPWEQTAPVEETPAAPAE